MSAWICASISVAFAGSRRSSCSREALPDRERHELLLRAVVDVALELAALLVLGGDEALLRSLEVGEPRLEPP